ncbi:DUF5683 domain-containing protein [Flavimarina sp. Hel_I_48]|uniref:DUF5683 domain-containing protein n=1 Tax=Flavimarina sp. Hel_I_48 TaxID=1392488 RepID=UPI0004DEDCD2|nr:DUF5683 domain-containing protein [Flavimarina sp. Hel_I_48]
MLGLFLYCFSMQAQVTATGEEVAAVKAQDSIIEDDYRPLKPAQVAFYSAVLPGLGQAYNKDYWKVPIVYAALGTGVGIAVYNQKEFQRYRTAYKDRIAGRIDEFTLVAEDGTLNEVFTADALLRAQTQFRRNKELAILISAGIYVLQIVEANVRAHLSQFNVDDTLTLNPYFKRDEFSPINTFGARLTYSF